VKDDLSIPEHRSGQQQGVNAVQDASVAGNEDPGVLDAG
jgi:hypothetical protein